jgi:hypothetical protein
MCLKRSIALIPEPHQHEARTSTDDGYSRQFQNPQVVSTLRRYRTGQLEPQKLQPRSVISCSRSMQPMLK